jgi:hypothetical protein
MNPLPATKMRLSLDRPATYQIIIQGRLDPTWADWFEGMNLVNQPDNRGLTLTILTGPVADQATLHGLLGKIYNLGLPLLAISCLDFKVIPQL